MPDGFFLSPYWLIIINNIITITIYTYKVSALAIEKKVVTYQIL